MKQQHPSNDLLSTFWRETYQQMVKQPRLAHHILRRSQLILARFQQWYEALRQRPRHQRRRLQARLGTSLAGAALALALFSGPSYAANITVTTTTPGFNADGQCSLSEAIVNANADAATYADCAPGSGADTITLSGNTYTLLASYNSADPFTGLPDITSDITIEGNGATIERDGSAADFRLLRVLSSSNFTLNDTTISGGTTTASGAGGGIYNRGTLTLNNSTVRNSSASFVGGGIYSDGPLTLNNSTVSGNGGGIGGGIYVYGTVTLNNSTVSGNSANSGGGIRAAFATSVTMNSSTVTGNSALYFGGLYAYYATLTLNNTIISGNSGLRASEVYNPFGTSSGSGNLFGHSGVTNAQAFGYYFTPGATDITATSDGNTPTALTDILDITLQNNGGPTETHALVTGSPAIDAVLTGPLTDQRGVSRPQGLGFDIGSFELQVNQAPVANDDAYSTDEDTTLNVPVPGVLGNDTDADGDSLTAMVVTGPSNGMLTLNADGSFTFTPDPGFNGSDSFTYKANDGSADSNTATVMITVEEVTAEEGIDALEGDVQALVDSGDLDPDDADKLFHRLDKTRERLADGDEDKAVEEMMKFIDRVEKLVDEGKLSPAHGDDLIDSAEAIIDKIESGS